METSILIAKIISIAYLSMGIGLIINKNYYKVELVKLLDNKAILLFGGFLAIVFGFIILENQNSWENNWTTLITLIGWIAIVKGVVLLIFPKSTNLYKNTVFNPKYMEKIFLPILIIVGLVFGYFGFFY